MILSDRDICYELDGGQLFIDPLLPRSLQPASYEVHLQEAATLSADHEKGVGALETWFLDADEFALGCTVEKVTIPRHLCAQVNGKSSLGRLGLLVHATAGYIDPGFSGQITLELKNISNHTIVLTEGMAIAQIVFHQLRQPAERAYGHPDLGSHYQGQEGIRRSYMDSSAGYGSLLEP
jgi:dCTP deaminase